MVIILTIIVLFIILTAYKATTKGLEKI